jgi:hypothetical protein
MLVTTALRWVHDLDSSIRVVLIDAALPSALD